MTPESGPRPSTGTRAQWAALEALFHEALSKVPEKRNAFLDASLLDPNSRSEVEGLLAAHDRPGALDMLVDEVMSPLLSVHEPPVAGDIMPTNYLRYRIIERLGGGGMGVVYRARDERLERDVALKFLSPHLSADQAAKKRFLVEARAAAALEHPNICTVHEIGDADGQLYIVMACYDGETLAQRITRAPLELDEALRIASEIARGLVKAHERGIVHRDIKPANVVVTADGHVKILDFGIAKLADVNAAQTVGAIGTTAYMSPEQAFGETTDHRTDIWSLGVVLYEMLTRTLPFRGPAQAVLYSILEDDPEPVGSSRFDVSTELDALIGRALAKRPADRWSTASELLAALTACRADSSVGAAPISGGTERRNIAPRDTALTRGGERRQVTVVSCAIRGYDALFERLSSEEAEHVLGRIREAAVDVATRHDGIVNQFSGDSLVMLFGVPTAHEDDALRAVRAALALRARVIEVGVTLDARLSGELRLRSGVHVAPVVAQRLREGDRRYRITGAAADVAGRLASVAGADVVLVSPEIRRLVGPFVHTEEASPVSLQPEGVTMIPHRVLGTSGVRSRLEGAAHTGLTPFVGRERERAAIGEWLASAREATGHFTALVGEAGVGKSRLLRELRETARASAMRVFVGRCEAYGGSTPFLPFVEAAHEALALPHQGAIPERHDAAVAALRAIDQSLEEFLPLYLALLSIPSERHPVPRHLRGELLQAAMLEAVAALFTLSAVHTPALLILEDWHWADEASRAALRQLAEMVPTFPLLVVASSRPDSTIDWGSADHHTLLHLSPLDGVASASIARAVLGAERVAPELEARLFERTGGNPFFLEEVCEALREEGAVTVRDGEAVAADASGALHVPETVQVVLRTRIDRLDEEARDTLRVSSVIGREFSRRVLDDVMERAPGLASSLERLKTSGLIQQVSVVPESVYRFKHALTHEVAYDSLLEHQRATLHAAAGRATERQYAPHLDEHVERLAHHFGRAESWPEAVYYGVMAADRAIALCQNADALNTLEEVEKWVQHLPDDDARVDLHADVLLRQERLCEALGLRHRQLALIEALIERLAPRGPSERLAQVYLRQGDAFTLLRRFEAADRALETSLRIARERGDDAGGRNALRSIALLRMHEGFHDEGRTAIERVLELARKANDTRAEAGDMATLANILRAMGQHDRALEVLEVALQRTGAVDNPIRHAALLNVIGTIHRDLGHYDTALEYFYRVASEGLEQRHPVNASFTLPAIAHILLQQGRTEEALATYRRAVEMNRKARYADGSAHTCRALGEALVGLDRQREALPHLRDAAALFAQLEDRPTEALMWRRVAVVHERLGEVAEARTSWETVRLQCRAIDDVAGEADAVDGMARAERQLGAAPKCVIDRYEEALALALRLGDRTRELSARNALGIVHWQRGGYTDAVRHYEAALRLCRDVGDRVHEGLILNSLGATLHRLRRWDEARTALAEAADLTALTGEKQLQAHSLATLAEVCLASGRLEEAETNVASSLLLRRVMGDRRGEGWMLECLARIHTARGALDAAHNAAEESTIIAQELGDESLKKAIARLHIITPIANSHYS
ncbi:MAG: tetratricopeptide repeat protein [bacterium]